MQKQQACAGQHKAADDGRIDGQREEFLRLFFFAFAHGFGDQRSAAGAEHEADSSENHYERHNKVNCRECSFSDVIRNK